MQNGLTSSGRIFFIAFSQLYFYKWLNTVVQYGEYYDITVRPRATSCTAVLKVPKCENFDLFFTLINPI
jgi:hypothetical protein